MELLAEFENGFDSLLLERPLHLLKNLHRLLDVSDQEFVILRMWGLLSDLGHVCLHVDLVALAVLLNNLTRLANGHELAFVHDGDPVAEELSHIALLSRQEHCAVLCVLVDRSDQFVLRNRVNALERVVEDDKLWLTDECHGQSQPAEHPIRHLSSYHIPEPAEKAIVNDGLDGHVSFVIRNTDKLDEKI